ncbi:MAG: hypothetical protein ACP5P3_04100 [Ignavibacteria bacterium]
MAKSKNKSYQKQPPGFVETVDVDEIFGKYVWLLIPGLTLVYYLIRFYSEGFYQDDEIAQYLNMIQFWKDPSVILGNNPKPGYKIFMVIPALISYDAVLLTNSLIAALTVFSTYKLLRIYEIKYAFAGTLLLAAQPLFVDLSFRSYSEIFTALCIVIFLILYKKEKYLPAAIVVGYIYTIRQEIAVFAIILSVILLRKKKYVETIALGFFPIVYDILGYFKTGDIFYIITEMRSVASLAYNTQGPLHYFKVYIFIIGPITLVLFLFGFLGFLCDFKNYKQYLKRYDLFYIIFITVFLVQIYTMWNNGPNPGNWRYLLHISPIATAFATVGINLLKESRARTIFYEVSGILLVIVLMFLSKQSDGFKLLEKSDYTKAIFIVLVMLSVMIFANTKVRNGLIKLSFVFVILSVVYLLIDFTPKKLSPENLTVRTAADFLNLQNLSGINVYTNHSVFMFFAKEYREHPEKFKPLNSKNVAEAPEGSIFFWENHYGYRPEWKNDVKIEDLKANPKMKLINQFTSSDKSFVIFVFEKIKTDG